jgi:glycosyltransferase involved in cell wall biosynthesis
MESTARAAALPSLTRNDQRYGSSAIVPMSTSIGISGIFPPRLMPTGVFSVFENLLYGFDQLVSRPQAGQDIKVTVFHGQARPPKCDFGFNWCPVSDRHGRFIAEALLGLNPGQSLDALLFLNYFTPPLVRAKRSVTVIHDLQYLHLPEHWPLVKRGWMRLAHAITLRRCDAVVAISQAVKDDILNSYGARWESRVHAIWNPVALDRFGSSTEQNVTGGRPYILCTAVDRPPKNLCTLIRAFARLRSKYPDYCLVLAGQPRNQYRAWSRTTAELEAKLPSAVDLVSELNLGADVITPGFVPDEQLGALYRGASLFVLPSLFEGFGMPAVESLALGAPTLVSDLPVLREVTLGAAQYVNNPRDEGEMADRIAQILDAGDAARPTPELMATIRDKFTPVTIARQYMNLLLGVQKIDSSAPKIMRLGLEKRDSYTTGVERTSADRVSKLFTQYGEIEFQKARALAIALCNTRFTTPKALRYDPTTSRVEFEYIPHTTGLLDAFTQAYQNGHVEDILHHNRSAGEMLADVHKSLKLSSATQWLPPAHIEREMKRVGSGWPAQSEVYLHCDFSPVNILVSAVGKLVLIDSSPNHYFTTRPDLIGPPVVDIATYTAKLYWPFRLRSFSINWRRLANTMRMDFLTAYEQASGVEVDRNLLGILERGVVRSFVESRSRSPVIVLPARALARLALPKSAV